MSTNSTTPPTKVLLGCSKCGAILPDEAEFCLKCGKPVSPPAKDVPVIEALPPAQRLRNRPRKRPMIIGILLAILAVAILWVGMSDSPAAQQVQEFVGWKHDSTILDNSFVVGPHTFRYYKFALPEGSVNVSIVGQFTSAADAQIAGNRTDAKAKKKEKSRGEEIENGIEVYVLTEPAFTIWQNGYATSSLYESGKVAAGTVQSDIPAGAGIYYLVFSNKFSPRTSKSVHAAVLLRYKSWLPDWFRRMKGRVWNWVGFS